MNRFQNPYAPGAGTRPPELAGRRREIEDFEVLLAKARRAAPERSMLITGLRGVGKTVLLNEFDRLAGDSDFFTNFREIPPDATTFRTTTTEICRKVLLAMSRREQLKAAAQAALGVLKSFSLVARVKDVAGMEWSVGIEPVPGKADSGDLSEDLADLFIELGVVARAHQTGVALFLDEVQNLSADDLSALIMALHRVNQKSMPVIVVAAGLPQLPRLAAEAQSYAERLFRFVRLEALPAEAAAEAIELPASRLGADFEPDALQAILEASGRYPYFLQEWGSKVWDIAPGPDFTLEDVRVAGVEVEAALDQGFFAVRAERATETERKLMRAMAWLGEGPYRWALVVDAFGGDLKTCSVLTDRLLKKGLVYRPRHAELDFTVPHFARFIRRHYPTLRR